MSVGQAIAEHALSLVGTRFRLHGRDPASGLDCVGLVLSCLAEAGRPLAFPAHYNLRNTDIAPLLALGEREDVGLGAPPCRPGDIILARPGPAQHHLLVAIGPAAFVHAHASLRRVVEAPFPAPWPILRHWRLT